MTNKKGQQAMKYREKVNKNVKKKREIYHDNIIIFFGEYHNHTSYDNFNI